MYRTLNVSGSKTTCFGPFPSARLPTVPSSLITLTPPAVATAIVGTGSPVAESIGAPGRTVMATSLTVRFMMGPAVKNDAPLPQLELPFLVAIFPRYGPKIVVVPTLAPRSAMKSTTFTS